MTKSSRAAPGRDQLLTAALGLIGQRGVKAATVRAVADEAGVTPGLVVHHFGTKEQLAAEVDALVLERFRAAMAIDNRATSPDDAARALADQLSATIGTDPALRSYVRRAILEASPTGGAIIESLVDLTIQNLRPYADPAKLPKGRDLRWLAVQVVTVNLAGTLLEPLLEPVVGAEPFTPTEVRRRTTANLTFLTAALHRYAN